MENEILKILIERKIQNLDTISNVAMLWWVSSVVFCGSVLSTLWIKRHEVIKIPAMDWLFIILNFFFLSIVIFGLWLIRITLLFKKETFALVHQLNVSSDLFSEFTAVAGGVGIGISSFLFVFLACIAMWRRFRTMRKAEIKMADRSGLK